MVTKFLDLDRDRQNRLENRLDHLLDVVHATVLNKSPERDSEVPPPPELLITNLLPPPKPGVIPPKLDLVPPKPCRVPCTSSNSNAQSINQNPVMTRPGMISPPAKKLGSIWTKLGPVSQSPFVKAQQQLGFQTIANQESRTQSSAERRILRDVRMNMDFKSLIEETVTFIENEKQIQEKIENARIQSDMGQVLSAKKRLFTQREPTAAMILSAAFLDNECQYIELVENARIKYGNNDITRMCMRYAHQQSENENDDLLAGQGDSYDRLRQLKIEDRFKSEPCDSSTPAKTIALKNAEKDEPRQTIQQLAQLVMQSARWRDMAQNKVRPYDVTHKDEQKREELRSMEFLNEELRREELRREELKQEAQRREELKKNELKQEQFNREENSKMELRNPGEKNHLTRIGMHSDGNSKALNWLQDRYSYGDNLNKQNQNSNAASKIRPIGFSIDGLNLIDSNPIYERRDYNFGKADFDDRFENKKQKVHFYDDMGPFGQLQQTYAQRYYTLQNQKQRLNENAGALVPQNRDMIDRYMREMGPRKGKDDSDDEEFLDTTATMSPVPVSRRGSLASDGTSKSGKGGCMIS